MKAAELIDTMKVNERVAEIEIGLRNKNMFSIGLMEWITTKWKNLYSIVIEDHLGKVDGEIHTKLKRMTE